MDNTSYKITDQKIKGEKKLWQQDSMFEDIGNIVNAIGNLIIQMCVCVCEPGIYTKRKKIC